MNLMALGVSHRRQGVQLSKDSHRIKGIDICRSVAIGLAMVSHVVVTFSIGLTGDVLAWVRFAMQMAPATFILLFGSMLEVAYASKFRAGNAEKAITRLLVRSAQCYCLYFISIIPLLIFHDYSILYGIRTALLIGVTPFTDILKFYALALLFAPLMIVIRLKFGLIPMALGAAFIQALYPLIADFRMAVPAQGKDYIGPALAFLYGGSEADVGAPSLLHGLSLVSLGFLVGWCARAFFSDEARQRQKAAYVAFIILACSLCVSAIFWTDTQDVLRGIATLEIRNDNHPFYYALGVFCSVSFLLLCLFLFDVVKLNFADKVRFLGSTSLFTFCFGNVLLYAQPWGIGEYNSVGLFVVFSALIMLQSYLFSALFGDGFLAKWRVAALVRSIMKSFDDLVKALIGSLPKAAAARFNAIGSA